MLALPAAAPMPGLDAIEATLADLIPQLRFDPATRGRPEILPSALLWGAVCVSILSGAPTQRAIWRTATGSGLWSYAPVAVTPEAVRQRLLIHGPTGMEAVFTQATTLLTDRWHGDLTLAPFATGGVYALDDTTLDKVAKTLPTADGPLRPLAGRLHTVFDVRRQCFQTVIPTDLPYQNERVAAPALLASLPRRSLVVMDRGYLSFKLYDDLTDGKRFFVTRLSDQITFTPTHVLTDTQDVTDVLGFLGSYRADRSKHLYRLVTVRGAFGTRRYLTNVRKPRKLTPAQLGALYARRWDIELAFKLIKRELGLHLIWATRWELVLTQIWATLLIAQLVLMLRLQLALRAGVDLFDVSMGLLLADLPRYVARGEADVLGAIVARGRYGGMLRPSRRTRLALPTNLPSTPPPKGHQRLQVPRYAGKQ
jgi:hypothetical protein